MNDRDTDILISRILDREAEPRDFDAFAEQAGTDPSAWKDLLAALRDDMALGIATGVRLDLAERVETPLIGLHVPRALPTWTGWAAALLLAFAWLGWGLPSGTESGLPAGRPGDDAVAEGSTDSRAQQPMTAGIFGPSSPRLNDSAVVPAPDRVLGELPPEMVSTRPAADGNGLVIVYVRRVVERARVASAWSLGTDELGNPIPVNVALSQLLESDLH